ncbi:MAG: hypothetical protein LUB59_06400 [Candidatus Gastranaerophilales bacterium]|nr:hypothetical protein [Candidatus Gastranaerophilales bacterium]
MNDKKKTVIDLSDAVSISDLVININAVLETDAISGKNVFLNLGKVDLKQSQLLSIKALIETMEANLSGIQTKSEMTEASAVGLGLTVDNYSDGEQPYQTKQDTEPKNQKEEIEQPEELNSFAQLKKLNSIGDFVTDTKSLPEVESENIEEQTQEFLDDIQTLSDENSYEAQEELSEEEINNIENSDLFKTNTIEDTNVYNEFESEHDMGPSEEVQSALDVTFGVTGVTESVREEEFEVFAKPQQTQDKFEDYEVTETIEKTEEDKYVLLDTEGITPEGIELIKSNTSDLPTLYLSQTLRSGQTVSYEGNIFIIGDAHPGSEVIATGDITVWGILGGIVHAGSKGNTDAKIRALKLNPIQLRIAHLYSRRNDTVNVPYVQKSNEFTPEEARIENKRIVIYKTLRRED